MLKFNRPKIRSYSASRQRQQMKSRSSLNDDRIAVNPHTTTPGNTVILPCIDLRTIPQKIEDLKKEILESKHDSNVIPIPLHFFLFHSFIIARTKSPSTHSYASLHQP
jgi:hypothetical protein